MTFLKLERSCNTDKAITLNEFYGTSLCENIAKARNFLGQETCNMNHIWPERSISTFNTTFSEELKDFIFQYAKSNMMILKVFIGETTATKILKDEKTSIISFIANTGGLLGLCMGFSVVSIFEIMSHLWTSVYKFLKSKTSML